jgi:glutathione peroxidase
MKSTATTRSALPLVALAVALGCAQTPSADSQNPAPTPMTDTATPAVLDFEMPALTGEPVELSRYHGRVVLIVNTASQCGLTPQYEPLQQLHEQYADDGLAILGFPANNFGNQEPGTDADIAAFCEQNYGVGFPMFAKLSVKGDDQSPLYAFLTSEETNPRFAGEITWNFEKFLVGRDGRVVARFAPRTRPDAEEVVAAIRAELAKPAPAGTPGAS